MNPSHSLKRRICQGEKGNTIQANLYVHQSRVPIMRRAYLTLAPNDPANHLRARTFDVMPIQANHGNVHPEFHPSLDEPLVRGAFASTPSLFYWT